METHTHHFSTLLLWVGNGFDVTDIEDKPVMFSINKLAGFVNHRVHDALVSPSILVERSTISPSGGGITAAAAAPSLILWCNLFAESD